MSSRTGALEKELKMLIVASLKFPWRSQIVQLRPSLVRNPIEALWERKGTLKCWALNKHKRVPCWNQGAISSLIRWTPTDGA